MRTSIVKDLYQKTFAWFGKYWNVILLLLLTIGAIAIILLWPAHAVNPLSSNDSDLVVFGFFTFMFCVILLFLAYIVILLRGKKEESSMEVKELPKKEEPEQEAPEWW